MTLPTHIIGGIASIALMDTILPSFTADKLSYAVGALVSTFPDLDYSRSLIGRLCYPLSTLIESKVAHRTATHSFLIAFIVSSILGWILSFLTSDSLLQWSVIVFVSYSSHIVLDWFTKKGAQSYWPAQGWCVMFKNRTWRVKTGSSGEVIFVILLISLFGITFQPSRDATIAWFRSSFIQSRDSELERFKIKRQLVAHGLTPNQIDSLHNLGIITNKEREQMLYDLQNITINERITRRMYGLPIDTSTTGVNLK